MSPDDVMQLGWLSDQDTDVMVLTSTTESFFGDWDQRDYYVQTLVIPLKLDLCVKEILQLFAEPIRTLPIEAACIGLAEKGTLTLMSKELSKERVIKPAQHTIFPAREGRLHTVRKWVIYCCIYALGSYVPSGSIIATCSQSVGTAMHSFSGFMDWGNTTATSTPRPTFGPKQDPVKNNANASGHPHAGAQGNNTFDHTERNDTTRGPGAAPKAEPVPPPCPPNADGNGTDSKNRTNFTNTPHTPNKFHQYLGEWDAYLGSVNWSS